MNAISRLRAIVRQSMPTRELTYVAEPAGGSVDVREVASRLGGVCHEAGGGTCVVVERAWAPDEWHGRRRVESYAIDPGAPLAMLDPRLAPVPDWASQVVFFDIETTGLSGGAGTLPLLVGCGWFEDGRFVVRQFFLSGPAGERAMLDGLAGILGRASLLVTYNGRTFDVPVMETRWAYHRQENPAEKLPHFDMLPVARRLWGEPRGMETRAPCTLTSLERGVLRFHRLGDVPGIEIPSRYFQFLRTGDVGGIVGVLDHNRHDILSLAAVMAHALRLAVEGADACEAATEQVGLGKFYERAGDLARAEVAYAAAATSDDAPLAAQALERLAVLLRRQARYGESAHAWQGVLTLSSQCSDSEAAPLARRATEALAIHHEHRARDLTTARDYAETLRQRANDQQAADAQRRLTRLERKIRSGSPTIDFPMPR